MNKIFLLLSTLLLAILGGLLGWAVFFTEGLLAVGDALNWTQFLGRFHPAVLHLPIGLFFGLFVLEIVALRQRSDASARSALVLVWLMAVTSVLTAYLGLLLASGGDYSGDTLWWHKCLGIIFAAAALVVTFFKVFSLCYAGKGLTLYRMLMIGLLVLLTFVGHNGGELTHGKGYLTNYAPKWLQDILDEPEPEESDVEETDSAGTEGNVFTHQVQPILEQYCVSCHGPEKQKSKYRVDTFEFLLTPGSIGDTTIEPYRMSESSLLEYLFLPESDDMAMPPEGKPRPSAEEIMIIAHWIANGAEGPPIDEAAMAAAKAVAEAEQAQVVRLFDAGILLLPVGKDSDLLYLDFQNVGEDLPEEALATLSFYKDRIYEIKLIGSDHAAKLLRLLEGASELRVLNVSGLQNADDLAEVLNSFSALELLNLFGSDLSGAGFSKLTLSNLQKLYVGSTQVSPEELQVYQKTNVSIQVFGDVDLSSIEALKAIDLENSAEFNPKENK
ncbi:MAG: c-type cytochrome domain-containing protein [Lentimonas sp.]